MDKSQAYHTSDPVNKSSKDPRTKTSDQSVSHASEKTEHPCVASKQQNRPQASKNADALRYPANMAPGAESVEWSQYYEPPEGRRGE